MYGLGEGGYENDIQAKTKRKEGQWGVSKQEKRGVGIKKTVSINKVPLHAANLALFLNSDTKCTHKVSQFHNSLKQA